MKVNIDGRNVTLNEIKLKYIIMGFLTQLNAITTGVVSSDMTDYDHPRLRKVVFESRLSSVFVDGAFWSPNELFWEIVHDLAKDCFLNYIDMKNWTYNNTKTVFSIDMVKICPTEENNGD